ncbi:MAG: amidohydrolase [Solirubrobacteraceae bacterium]
MIEQTSARTRRTADRAILGASILTLDPRQPRASAVAFRDGVIVAVGDAAAVRRECDSRTEVIDGAGMVITPGLVDAHIHPFWVDVVAGVQLSDCKTLDEVLAALARERDRVGDGAWVRGWGLEYALFKGVPIRGAVIEDAVQAAPALVTFFDGHTAVATRSALELAGVAGPVALEGSAEVVVDEDQRPTGELREEAAISRVVRAIPPLTDSERYDRVVEVQRMLNRLGLTGAHAMDGNPGTFDLLRELEANGDLTTRVVVPFWQSPDMTFEELEGRLPLRGEKGRLWRGGVAKFFLDGVVETGTAWLLEPDSRGAGTQPFWADPARYAAAVGRYAAAGFQCVTHAIGDRAVREVLDVYKSVGAPGGVPHRIEHIETLQDSDLPRFAAERVVASQQPIHLKWRQADGGDEWTVRLGPERSARAWRFGDLVASGAIVALGSDWPVASCDPRVGMAWARLRRRPGDRDAVVFEPQQRLTGAQALTAYTVSNQTAVGEQDAAGRVAVGFRADLTGFAEDPVTCDADALPLMPVSLTVVDGRVVHNAIP